MRCVLHAPSSLLPICVWRCRYLAIVVFTTQSIVHAGDRYAYTLRATFSTVITVHSLLFTRLMLMPACDVVRCLYDVATAARYLPPLPPPRYIPCCVYLPTHIALYRCRYRCYDAVESMRVHVDAGDGCCCPLLLFIRVTAICSINFTRLPPLYDAFSVGMAVLIVLNTPSQRLYLIVLQPAWADRSFCVTCDRCHVACVRLPHAARACCPRDFRAAIVYALLPRLRCVTPHTGVCAIRCAAATYHATPPLQTLRYRSVPSTLQRSICALRYTHCLPTATRHHRCHTVVR